MAKFFRNFFLPTRENSFCPRIIGFRALAVYAVISATVFIVTSSFPPIGINRFLADLTRQLIILEVNPAREEGGVMGLRENSKLTEAAQLKAEDMIRRGYFSHVGPNGERPWSWFEKVDYEYAAAGENLAINFTDPKVLVDAWLNSPLHAKKILNGYFTDIGIGVAKGDMGGGNAIVVVMFLGEELTPAIKTAANQNPSVSLASGGLEAEEEPIESIAAETPVVRSIVEEKTINEENKILAVGDTEKIEASYSELTESIERKLFIVNIFSYEMRLGFTIFLNILILWVLVSFILNKERFGSRAINSLLILVLVFTIWLPEIL